MRKNSVYLEAPSVCWAPPGWGGRGSLRTQGRRKDSPEGVGDHSPAPDHLHDPRDGYFWIRVKPGKAGLTTFSIE